MKIGDKVKHKLKNFDAIIIGECVIPPAKRISIQNTIKETGAKYLKCRFFNTDLSKFEEDCFFDFELEISEN